MNTHPLQTPAWADFRRAMGIDVVEVSGWFVSFHKIPATFWTIGYFPKGPLPTKKMIDELNRVGKEKHAIFIQLEPNIEKGSVPLPPSHHPLFTKYTFILDLNKSENELLAAMHSKTRYNIRIAQKHGVVVREDNDAFDTYLALTKETTNRQGFYAHNELYHRTMWNIMHKAGIAHLFTAVYNNEILSAWIVFVYGDTIYYPYGSSSRNHREVMAPTLLLWEIAKWSRRQTGIKKFDLWGADQRYGFHKFKQGFNPALIEFAGSFDLVINKPLYILYTLADTIRWKILHGITAITHLR